MSSVGILWSAGLVFPLLGMVALILVRRKRIPGVLLGAGVLGSGAVALSGIRALFAAAPFRAVLWELRGIGAVTVGVDHLSAFFLLVTGLIGLPAAIFTSGRLRHSQPPDLRRLGLLYLGLYASLPLVLTAADAFLFLLAWELMSVILYVMISSRGATRAGYVMLAVGEAGTLAVLISLLLMGGAAGSLQFETLRTVTPRLAAGVQWAVFLLSFLGFGVKAGLLPLNFWLSRAYTACPNAVIPLVAGATLNLGFYGLLRVDMDLLPVTRTGIGLVMLVTGAATALLGILYATIEDDFKALLAHSSMENAGIIATAMGAGAVFLACGHRAAAAMAMTAALYHLLNHSAFKSLLFMGSSVVEEATGTRSLDRMGGLLKRMPWTGLFVLVGALAISAMPPFNGFVSEWLTIQSLLRSVALAPLGVKIAFVAAGVGLALTAGLAVTCFVRVFAMAFLGMPRSEAVTQAGEKRTSMLAAMALLAVACLALGVLPTYVIPLLDQAVTRLVGVTGSSALVPPFFPAASAGTALPATFVGEFHQLGAQVGHRLLPGRGLVLLHRGGQDNPVVFAMSTGYMVVTLVVLLALSAGLVRFLARGRRIERKPVWAGGIRKLLPEMTYTASGFAQPVRVVFEALLRPRVVDRREAIAEHFRTAIHRQREEVHMTDRMVFIPLAAVGYWISGHLTRMHSGWINGYAMYALWALVTCLVIAMAF